MSYAYEQSVPFKYKKYTELKSVTFTDEIKTHLDNFYQDIGKLQKDDYLNDKGKLDKTKIETLISDLSVKYQALRNQYIKPVVEKEYKYKELLYTQEEVDFIFVCSYALIDEFGFSQVQLAKIFGLNKNKFSKLGCFPVRCHDAYTKLKDESARKCLIPNDLNSTGIQIAECINKEVQAVYACSAFVGVSNDLDLFANISATDKKSFILTSPMDFDDGNVVAIERANYAFARFNFALGNQLFNDKDEYVPAGEIKRKIEAMLKMEDSYVLSSEEERQMFIQLFLSDSDLKGFLLTGKRYSEFEDKRKEFRAYYESMNIEHEKLEDGYVMYLAEYYDQEIDMSETTDRDMKTKISVELSDDEKDEEARRIVTKHYVEYKNEVERLEQELLSYIDTIKVCKLNNISLQDWVRTINISVKSNLLFKRQSSDESGRGTGDFLEPMYEDRLRSAASYWISEVFANYDGNEEFYNDVIKYLGRKSPLFDYFDVLNAPPSGEMKQASSNERTNIHIYMRDESFELLNELSVLEQRKRLASADNTPILLYIDADAYFHEDDIYTSIQSLFSKWKIVVVVHDKDGVLSSQLDVLDKKLGLYISTNVEEI